MYIILDTNVFVSNWRFNDSEHEALLDFLKKTQSFVLMPEIVWDEIEGLYKEKLKEALSKIIPALGHVNSLLVPDANASEKAVILPYVDIDTEYLKYQQFLRNLFGLHEETQHIVSTVLKYPENALADLAKRAIKRQKPFSVKGEEFRDGILWHNVLQATKDWGSGTVVFISANTNEFADKSDISRLHPTLQEEAKALLEADRLRYYPSLRAFLNDLSLDDDYPVDKEWVRRSLDFISVRQQATQYLTEVMDVLLNLARQHSPVALSVVNMLSDYPPLHVDFKESSLANVTSYPFANGERSLFAHLFTAVQIEADTGECRYFLTYFIHFSFNFRLVDSELIFREVSSIEPHFERVMMLATP